MSKRSLIIKDPQNVLPDLKTPVYVIPTEYGLVPNVTPDINLNLPFYIPAADCLNSDIEHDFIESLGHKKVWKILGLGSNYFNMKEGPNKSGIPVYSQNGVLIYFNLENYEKVIKCVNPQCVISLYSNIPPYSSSRQKALRINTCKSLAKKYDNVINFAHGLAQIKNDFGLYAEFNRFTEVEAEIIRRAIDIFDENMPRMIKFFGHPIEAKLAKDTGFDIFISDLPNYYARRGFALHFHESDTHKSIAYDLKCKDFEHDHGPLTEGCKCCSCIKYTRSYIYHLLNVHEILAKELLMLHNVYYYSKFIENL